MGFAATWRLFVERHLGARSPISRRYEQLENPAIGLPTFRSDKSLHSFVNPRD